MSIPQHMLTDGMGFFILFMTIIVAGTIVILVAIAIPGTTGYNCFEDEVVAWDGDAHTRCINIDDVDAYYERTFG